VDEFIQGPFAQARVDASIAEIVTQIRPFVVEAQGGGGAPLENEWNGAVDSLRLAIAGARANRGIAY
jgi:hypothetical protein